MAGSFTFTVQVTGSSGLEATREFDPEISAAPGVPIPTVSSGGVLVLLLLLALGGLVVVRRVTG